MEKGANHMRYQVIEQRKDETTTYVLIDHDLKTEAEIIPSVGNNLIAFRQDGNSFISEPPSLKQLTESQNYYKYGSAILFPPNRVKDATYTFNGQQYKLVKNENPNHLHGELCSRAWNVLASGADGDHGCYLVSEFSIQSYEDIFEYFPHQLTFETTYRLKNGKLIVEGKVTNHGEEEAPFALGFHPYFNVPKGGEKQVEVTVPAFEEWPVTIDAFVKGLPEKTSFVQKLKNGITLDHFEDLFCSLVTLDKTDPVKCSLHYKDKGLRLIYELDPKQFPFLILFKPDWSSALSLEPYTYVTDAFNLPWEFEKTGGKGVKQGEEISFQWKLLVEKDN